jgi:hypothetical protein
MGVDVNSSVVKVANSIFKAMLAKLKRVGKAKVVYKEPLLKTNLEKLYMKLQVACKTVFVDFML